MGNNHGVGVAERLGQFVLENIAAGGVAARLEDRPDALVRVAQAQRAQRLADGGRMMAEIVHHRHAAGDAAHFHAALDALERVEGGLNLLVGQAAMLGAGDDGQGVAHVEFADQVEMELEAGNFKLGGRRAVAQIEALNALSSPRPKRLTGQCVTLSNGARFGSSPLASNRPLRGIRLISRLKEVWIAARFSKMSA